jgi:hypothetical protein
MENSSTDIRTRNKESLSEILGPENPNSSKASLLPKGVSLQLRNFKRIWGSHSGGYEEIFQERNAL